MEQAASGAFERLRPHAQSVDLGNVDESTFRSFFLAALKEECPGAHCQTEWHTFDLLVQHAGLNALIEFKFLVMRRTQELDGRRGHWKGEAGTQNEDEFWACVKKLREQRYPVKHKYVLLVYQKSYPLRSKYSFAKSYDNLAHDRGISTVTDIQHCMGETLACKLIEVA
ncbi:MAG: hypothetical protein FJ288_16405 [Planctomycetes bacterium]|nr:hypothetical protein [Planctomycetota bacterium]